MTTVTSDEQKPHLEESIAPAAAHPLQKWLLVLVVFVAGAASLGVEMAASRLLAPYFGSSQFVWAALIGLILLYLTSGYYLGGRLADRFPRPIVFYLITTIAAFTIGLIPLISRPILLWSLNAFATYSASVFIGSLAAVILLFAIPVILLGCVSPFAIRLLLQQVGRSGRLAGQLYAISTAGSIVGTFLPVLWLIPNYGTRFTFLVTAITLLLVSILGLVVSSLGTGNGGWPPRDSKHAARINKKSLLSLLLLIPLGLEFLALRGPIKPASGTDGGGVLIAERESDYNYIQVVRVGSEMQLILNEGQAVHSVYDPTTILTGGPWDYFMIAPYFNKPPFTPAMVHRVAIIGLGAGTIPREITAAYGPIPIDGVEIDPAIVELGRRYFAMNEPNLHVIVQDGRYFLRTTTQKYDLIGIDAYQQPYVPFQLATEEFFSEVRAHLTPTGVAVINAGRTRHDFRLVETLAQTMHAVFPNVYIIDTARFTNSIIVGTNATTSLSNFARNTAMLTNPLLVSVAQASLAFGNLREEQGRHVFFTDDRSPIEQLIDQMILDAIRSGDE
uniref:Spermidine synthase n=1 Tax=Thermogemmatispora argillosa TaxID=2045280 RepID=A0A455T1P6_9CHLR|nr:spermidine synthase [Thermogemmatispora argillosa]